MSSPILADPKLSKFTAIFIPLTNSAAKKRNVFTLLFDSSADSQSSNAASVSFRSLHSE
jgi:hypothetical protein